VQRAIAVADWFAEEQLRILNAGRMERKAARLKKVKELIIQRYNGRQRCATWIKATTSNRTKCVSWHRGFQIFSRSRNA
jgi:hypothetical protein